ncbi:hypothetical protein Mal4_01310 [Maioricimonas rarisocia]|uniref:Uncharacterized protein n=1 Tax=Maioricimonas rarisocia TaxID=2528026 RepID=A0A517Z0B2_9PLAN|nr:hypothetical protein [Maioricimonas rarisocia]QDU35849.1 hypothetical protein Mal4_01310 [Maioricimonas rarisocia]
MTSQRSRRLIVLAVALLASCNLLILILPRSPPDVRSSLVAAPPAERSPLEDYVAQIASESIDECLANLNKHEDLLVAAGVWSNEPAPEVQFAACLANRRLARLFEHLQQMPPAESDRRCRAIFRDKFAIHKHELDVVMTMWEEGTPPQKPRPLFENTSALCAAVFLSAYFCPIEETLRQLDAWHRFGRSFEQRAAANPELPSVAKSSWCRRYASPESLFEANIYGMMLQDRCGVILTSERARGGFDLEGRALCRWDAYTNLRDATHQSGDAPVDTAGDLFEFQSIRSFGSIGLLHPKYRTDVVAKLRKQLLACTGTEYQPPPADEDSTP